MDWDCHPSTQYSFEIILAVTSANLEGSIEMIEMINHFKRVPQLQSAKSLQFMIILAQIAISRNYCELIN